MSLSPKLHAVANAERSELVCRFPLWVDTLRCCAASDLRVSLNEGKVVLSLGDEDSRKILGNFTNLYTKMEPAVR